MLQMVLRQRTNRRMSLRSITSTRLNVAGKTHRIISLSFFRRRLNFFTFVVAIGLLLLHLQVLIELLSASEAHVSTCPGSAIVNIAIVLWLAGKQS